MNLETTILGGLLTVVSYFLIKTMSKLDLTHDLAKKNETEIALLKLRQQMTSEHIDEKFAAIQKSMEEIKTEIKKLNK